MHAMTVAVAVDWAKSVLQPVTIGQAFAVVGESIYDRLGLGHIDLTF